MRKLLIVIPLSLSVIFYSGAQSTITGTNVSYNYYSSPGFVNITEVTGAPGIGNICNKNSWYYFGATNIFGFEMARNFICGAGLGYYQGDYRGVIPVFVNLRYTSYSSFANPFLYADGGIMLDPIEPDGGSKVFFNPGIGLSRSIKHKMDLTFSSGFMLQMGDAVERASFVNFRLGLIFRKYAMRLHKPAERNKDNLWYLED